MRKLVTIIYYAIIGILIARAIMSWFPGLQENVIGQIVYMITEPVLAPLKKIIPGAGRFDFTIIILWFGLSFLYRWIMPKLPN